MKRFAKILIGLAILAFAITVSSLLWVTRPRAEKTEREERPPVVEFQRAAYESAAFDIPSQGLVRATRRSRLTAEVGGRVVEISPRFETGRTVEKDEILLELDDTDYRATLAQAQSTLAEAEATLANEEARAEQARRDWEKLGRGGKPSPLTLREPQVRSARERVEAARSAVERARKDVSRTVIRAPFDAVISSKDTELGNTLTPGAPIAEIFATEPFEVRLPLSIDEVPFLESDGKGNLQGEVTARASAAGVTRTWTGKIVRTEGEIDRDSRSLHVVARIETAGSSSPLRLQPGLFVDATIAGRTVPDVAAIPFSAFLDLDRVAVIDPDDRLRFRTVDVIFREGDTVWISGGVEEGSRVCLTELASMVEGIRVAPRPVSAEDPGAKNDSETRRDADEPQPEPKP